MSEHRPGMGAFPVEGGFAFRVWAPNADAVRVVEGRLHRYKTAH